MEEVQVAKVVHDDDDISCTATSMSINFIAIMGCGLGNEVALITWF